jgi:predicted amidophosphoribosyltransferase
MVKEKSKPVWRKSYIKIITEGKGSNRGNDTPQCEYCGSPMPAEAMYCPNCGRVRKAEV